MTRSTRLNQLAVIGLGLIGGSLARAIGEAGFAEQIVAFDADQEALDWALEQGIIGRSADSIESAIGEADLVVVAVPVGAIKGTLEQIGQAILPHAVITDVGSSKVGVLAAAKQALGDNATRFVPGHPIAGKENSGVQHSHANLFQNHRVILTPDATTDLDAVELVRSMWQAAGGEVKRLDAGKHDRVMAATSHLPHVLAYSAVNTLAELDVVDEIFEFAAGGFRDFSRIASSDPIMWRDICLANASAILEMIDHYQSNLQQLKQAIEQGAAETLFEEFSRSKQVRDDYLMRYEQSCDPVSPEHSLNPHLPRETDATVLKVAGVPEHFNLPWHTAIESGAFENADLRVEFIEFPGGTGQMTRALEEGEVDLAILLAEGAVADLVKRRRSKLVKVYVESPLIWGIHVAADSTIQEVSQIRDQRYAISRYGSGSHLMAIVDAAERGWSTDELKFEVVKSLGGARSALADKGADTFFWERFTTQPLVDNGEFRRVGQRKTLWPAFVVAADMDSLELKGQAIRRALDVINRQCGQLMVQPDADELIASRYDLRTEQVQEWLSLTRWSVDFQCPVGALRRVLDYLNRLGIIDAPDVDVDDLWTTL